VTRVWRLIVDGPVDGALNMALDRAIQVRRQQGSAPPTLRLYRWSRPTVTLGRFQRVEGVDASFCQANGIDIVRRFTGGRGVLHDDEVTYSVIAAVDDGVPSGVARSYRHLCAALAEAYAALGARAELTERDRGHRGTEACYLQTTRADLSSGDAKLSGSAQVWLGETVMQHGSFVMTRDVASEARVFRLDPVQARRLADHTTTLEALLGRRPGHDEIIDAVKRGFERSLGITLVGGELGADEAELAASLAAERYVTAHDDVPSVRT